MSQRPPSHSAIPDPESTTAGIHAPKRPAITPRPPNDADSSENNVPAVVETAAPPLVHLGCFTPTQYDGDRPKVRARSTHDGCDN